MNEIEKPYVVVHQYGGFYVRRVVKATAKTWSYVERGTWGAGWTTFERRASGAVPETRFATEAEADEAMAKAKAAKAEFDGPMKDAEDHLRETAKAQRDAIRAIIGCGQ